MNQHDMRQRTKDYAKRIIRLCTSLPQNNECRRISDQLFRSGTSVGANYRAACRSRSKAEFISKLGIVLEEADETLYWLELIEETKQLRSSLLQPLLKEANEIVAMLVSSIKTSKNILRL